MHTRLNRRADGSAGWIDEGELLRHSPTPLVEQLFALLLARIQSRQLAAGTRLPSVRLLAHDSGVSIDTVSRAYDKLVAHGHADARPGSGFYVKSSARAGIRQSAAAPDATTVRHLHWNQRLIAAGGQPDQPGSGVVPDAWQQPAGLAQAIRRLGRAKSALSGYGDPLGYLPLRQQLQRKLLEVDVHAPADQLVTTTGATQALSLLVRTYMNSTMEPVLVEDPCSFMLRDCVASMGLQQIPVPRLVDGPDTDELRRLCGVHRPRFFFCSSVLHNPTSTQLSPYRAHQILRIADEFDLTLVEDDSFSDLMPSPVGITRLAALDRLERVVYVGSFSKTMPPGLRVGFLAASADRIERIALYKHVNCLTGSQLSERAVYQMLTQGQYRHHCEQLRARLDERRGTLVRQLLALGWRVPHPPEAGLFVWADLGPGVDAQRLAVQLAEQGCMQAAGELFSATPALHSCMRFNIATTDAERGLRPLVKLLQQRR